MTLDLFAPREKFLVLEVLPKAIHGFFLSVDDDRNLIFEKRTKDVDLNKTFASPALGLGQKSWEGQYLFKSRRKVIAIADSRVATTIPVPLELHRDQALVKDGLALSEFENLIAQAMAKIFNRCRTEAGTRLKTGDLDTIMVRAKVGHMKFDGKPIADPVGRAGKKISLLLELTFTRRKTFDDLKHLFSSPEEFFFVEAPQVGLGVLSQIRSLPLNLVVANDDGTTSSLFVLEKTDIGHPVLYREALQWHSASLIEEIMAHLDIPKPVAEELYAAYRTGKVSETVGRHLARMIDASVKKFLAEIEAAKIKGPVYVDAPHALPFDLPYRSHGVVFESAPLHEVMEKFGFKAPFAEWELSPSAVARYLTPFFEAYFEKDNSEINRKLRRRLHWLAE